MYRPTVKMTLSLFPLASAEISGIIYRS